MSTCILSARWRFVVGLGLVFILAAAGCTPIPRVVTRPGQPVVGRDSVRVPPRPRPGTPVAVVVDSAPSPAALGVLASIPEPLPPEERVAPPEIAPPMPESTVVDTVPADSPETDPIDTTGEVPVPSPTPKLGDIVNPGLEAPPDTAAQRADSVRAVSPPPRTSAPAPAPAREKTPPAPAPAACWRVQIIAPKEKAEADRKRSAAESILLIPMVVEREGGLYKIRTRDCFTRATADVVRGRAVDSGFAGAFPFEGVKR